MGILPVIMIGDVVGGSGLEALERRLPALIKKYSAVFTVVNGENSAEGFGMTRECLNRILAAGADAVTSGNHVWEKRDFWQVLEEKGPILRPANYTAGTPGQAGTPGLAGIPGQGCSRFEKTLSDGAQVSFLVINLQGREFMNPIDCPFRCFDALEIKPDDIALVDFHAESCREKEALGFYLDGRAAVVAGTHTHVQTADERILQEGSAYISDLGMTGITGGVIGMDPKICIDRARSQVLYRMETAAGGEGRNAAVQGIIAEIDSDTRKAVSIKRINEKA
ncbi:MAG: YmdB family metallophosphoesterase [Treponema sp.]|nr:YmdB family metallophosphoesterase [Treponema sp.]